MNSFIKLALLPQRYRTCGVLTVHHACSEHRTGEHRGKVLQDGCSVFTTPVVNTGGVNTEEGCYRMGVQCSPRL